jgi:hypothetical protein
LNSCLKDCDEFCEVFIAIDVMFRLPQQEDSYDEYFNIMYLLCLYFEVKGLDINGVIEEMQDFLKIKEYTCLYDGDVSSCL